MNIFKILILNTMNIIKIFNKISILIKIIITLYKSKLWSKFGAPEIENFKKKIETEIKSNYKYEVQIEIHRII